MRGRADAAGPVNRRNRLLGDPSCRIGCCRSIKPPQLPGQSPNPPLAAQLPLQCVYKHLTHREQVVDPCSSSAAQRLAPW